MKNSKFIINVGDLLLSAGKNDEISFENEMISEINGLTKDGISGKVLIQSFNKESLLVTLQDIKCTIKEPCDRCTKEYERNVSVDHYSAKFQAEPEKDYDGDDEVFLIDSNETIDIKEMIINAILLQEPFTKKCEECLKYDEENGETEDGNLDVFEGKGNINFR